MENKMRLSKAVKVVYQAAVPNRLTASIFVSDFLATSAIDQDGYIKYQKELIYRGMAEELQKKSILTHTRRENVFGDSGTEIRGECYVFTQTELLQLLDDLEAKVLKDHAPKTVWGD